MFRSLFWRPIAWWTHAQLAQSGFNLFEIIDQVRVLLPEAVTMVTIPPEVRPSSAE